MFWAVGYSQCPATDLVFTSQAQIDAFGVDAPDCAFVTGSVTVSGADITDLSGLNGITSIGGQLAIIDNPLLASLAGWNEVALLGENAKITLRNNTVLEELMTFFGVLNQGLELVDLPVLNDLSEFTGISSVLDLIIVNCGALTNLSGLENAAVSNQVNIQNNPVLTSIFDLEGIDPTELQEVTITGNSSLFFCSEVWLCKILFEGAVTVTINSNAFGCDSSKQVLDKCIIGVNDLSLQKTVELLPNPASNQVLVKLANGNSLKNTVIYKATGQQVLASSASLIDLSTVSQGLYFIAIETQQGIIVKRLVKE